MKNFLRLSKPGIKRKIRMHSLIMLSVFSLSLLSFVHPEKGKMQKETPKKGQGIILNVPADALMNHTKWGADIDSISKDQAIAALKEYVSQYANTQVNSLLFNVNYLRACYDSKVMTPYWDVPDPANNTTEWFRKYWQVNKKGIDVFEVCVAQSRAIKVSPWLSFRMNDHHYRDNPYCLNSLMLEHPELRLSPTGSFDYARIEVREYYKSFIKEALERYDVDGIELDWMRTQTLFKPGMESQGIEIINNFMKEIRGIVDQNATERGHSIEIAARVPVTPAIGRKFGLDGVAWVKDYSVDIIIPSNFFRPTNFDIPVELWKSEIGDTNSYIIAPGADAAFKFKSKNSRTLINSIETMRAFAISAYFRGAGSVYLFNNHSWTFEKKVVNLDGSTYKVNDKPIIISEGGTFSTIDGKPRRHVITYNDPDLVSVSLQTVVLKKDIKKEFDINSGPKPAWGDYIIRIALGQLTGNADAQLVVMLNDKPCIQLDDVPRDPAFNYANTDVLSNIKDVSETGARVMQFKADSTAVTDGYNHISIINNQITDQEITWLEVFLPFNHNYSIQAEFFDNISGETLEGLEVEVEKAKYLTNSQGIISIPGLSEGGHKISYPDNRFAVTGNGIIDVHSDSLIRISVKKLPTYSVLVEFIDSISEKPIEGLEVIFHGVNYLTNNLGIISIPGLLKGYYKLVIPDSSRFLLVGEDIIDVHTDSSIRVHVKKIPHLILKVISRTTGDSIYRVVVKVDDLPYFSNSSGIVNLGEYSLGPVVISASHNDYFSLPDTILFTRDTTIILSMTPRRANVKFQVSDINGPLSGVTVNMTDSHLTNSSGNAFFFLQPALENYVFSVERAGYSSVKDTFYLEIDTTFMIILEKTTSVSEMDSPDILIRPNPFDSYINVSMQEKGRLYLYDLSGVLRSNILMEQGMNTIPSEDLEKGVYIIKIIAGKRVYNNLIIKSLRQ